MAWHAGEQNHPCLFRLTVVRAQKLNGHTLPPAGTHREIHWTPSREDLRANPEIPADASVRGSLLAFSTRDSRGQWQQVVFFHHAGFAGGTRPETVQLPMEYRDRPALPQTRGPTAYAGSPVRRHGGEGTAARCSGLQSDAGGDERGRSGTGSIRTDSASLRPSIRSAPSCLCSPTPKANRTADRS